MGLSRALICENCDSTSNKATKGLTKGQQWACFGLSDMSLGFGSKPTCHTLHVTIVVCSLCPNKLIIIIIFAKQSCK